MTGLYHRVEWLFFFAVLLLSTGAFAPLWNKSSVPDAALHGDARLQVVWIVVYCTVGLLLLFWWRHSFRVLLSNRLLVILTMTALASVAWSAGPTVTARKAIALFGTTLLALLFSIDFNLRSQLYLLALVLGSAAALSLIAMEFAPQLFPPTEFAGTAWNGIFSHKNMLGRAMSLGTLTFLSLDGKSISRIAFAATGVTLCAAVLLASRSQTAFVVLLALLFAAALCHLLRQPWKSAVGTVLLLAVCASPFLWFAFAHPGELALLLHRNATLTGRSRIWTFAALSFSQYPWLGYGYGAFWWVSRDSIQALSWIGYKTPHAHNGFLDLGLQLGFVGLLIFVATWSVAFRDALKLWRLDGLRETRWLVLYLLFIVFYSLTENSLLEANSLLWIVFISTLFNIQFGLRSLDSRPIDRQ